MPTEPQSPFANWLFCAPILNHLVRTLQVLLYCQIVISWSGWQCIDMQYSVITLLLLSLWYRSKNSGCFITPNTLNK